MSCRSVSVGLKSCLSTWKSVETDFSPQGFHVLSRRLQPRDSQSVIELLGRVCTVSVETMKIVKEMP
jgi:hypothetical protein